MNDPVILEFSFEHETKNWYTNLMSLFWLLIFAFFVCVLIFRVEMLTGTSLILAHFIYML